MRDSFIFYRSFFEAIDNLPKENQLNIYKAISEFSLNNKEIIELNGIEKSIFVLIKPQLEANNKKYINGKKQKKSKTEAKQKQKKSKTEAKQKQSESKTEAKQKQSESKTEGNVNDNVNDNVNVNVNNNVKENNIKEVKENKKFIKPTLEEIKNYCIERKNNINEEKFFNYYESNGWKVGKNPMKDWKACIRTWENTNLQTKKEEKVIW